MKFYAVLLVAVLGLFPAQAGGAGKVEDQYTLAFTAGWCHACERDKRFYSAVPNLHVIDVDRFPGAQKEWRVNQLPTYIVVRGNREVFRTGNIHKVIQYHGS